MHWQEKELKLPGFLATHVLYAGDNDTTMGVGAWGQGTWGGAEMSLDVSLAPDFPQKKVKKQKTNVHPKI